MRLLVHVAVRHINPKPAALQPFFQLFDEHDRTVFPAGASESDREISFSFLLIERQSELEKAVEPLEERLRLVSLENVFGDFGLQAALVAQLVNEKRIGEKARVENDVGIVR